MTDKFIIFRKIIDELFFQFIDILKQSEYAISSKHIQRLSNIYSNRQIHIIAEKCDCNQILLFDLADNPLCSIPVQNKSQILDIPPFWNGKGWTAIKPVIVYNLSKDDKILNWITAHEIVHYLSIGHYLQTENNRWEHFLGINKIVYKVEDSMLKRIDCESVICNRFNEFFTDYTAWHLMKKLNGYIPPLYDSLQYFDDFLKTNCSTAVTDSILIGWYLSGMNDEMKKYLLGDEYNNFDEFCMNICNGKL